VYVFALQVNAHDRDLGFNGDLLYAISDGDADSVFRIDAVTGELFVDGSLDRETTPEYTLNLTVYDQVGGPFKCSHRPCIG
jgi:protocadherin Fat 1/2/3